MPNEEVLNNETVETPTAEETQQRGADIVYEEMMSAMAQGDGDRFEELEKEFFALDNNAEEESEAPEEETSETVEEEVPATEEELKTEETEVKPEEVTPTPEFLEMKKALEEAQRERDAIKSQMEQKPVEPVSSAPVNPTVATPEMKLPEAPNYPDIPSDPTLWDEKHIKANQEFIQAQAKYREDVNKYLAEVGKTTQKLVETAEQQRVREDNERRQNEAKQAEESFWGGIRDLQKSIPQLGTDTDILDVHKNIATFGDNLAALNGYTRGTTPSQSREFERAKQDLVVRYNKGEEAIVNRAESAGIVKPTGFDTYMSISEINTFRQQMIDSGELGSKSSFRDAYLLKMERDGTLAESFNDVAVREREQANIDTANKLKESQDAVRTPSNVAPQSATTTSTAAESENSLTTEEKVFLEEVMNNPQYPFQSTERMKYWEQLETKIRNNGLF